MRLIARGLALQGIALPAPGLDSATVDLADKRALLVQAVKAGGLGCLVLVGQGVHGLETDATLNALIAAPHAPDLLRRWLRLECYIHSRHRTRVLHVGECEMEVLHESMAAEPPQPAEDWLILGVLVGLIERSVGAKVVASAAGLQVYPNPQEAALLAISKEGNSARWQLRWTRARQPAHPPAPMAVPEGRFADALAAWLAGQLVTMPDLADAARAFGTSTRALQRELQASGERWQRLVQRVRSAVASTHLIETDAPLAEIGYLCGYADQAHFTRRFRQVVGLTPGQYRESFSAHGSSHRSNTSTPVSQRPAR